MILTYEEIRKAAEFAAEQMWPESGYVGWTEDDAVYHRKFIEACLEKLRGGVELPEAFAHAAYEEHPSYEGVGDIVYYHPNAKPANCIDLFTHDQLLQYGDARALAAREQAIEEWRVHLLALWEKGDFDLKDALAASPELSRCAAADTNHDQATKRSRLE